MNSGQHLEGRRAAAPPPMILKDIAQVYYNARSALDLMVLLPPPKKRFKIFVAAYEMFPL